MPQKEYRVTEMRKTCPFQKNYMYILFIHTVNRKGINFQTIRFIFSLIHTPSIDHKDGVKDTIMVKFFDSQHSMVLFDNIAPFFVPSLYPYDLQRRVVQM